MVHDIASVIFDLDGTLVDSLRDIAAAMDHALGAFGLPTWPLDRYRGFVGSGVRVLAERAVPAAEHQRLEDVIVAFRERYFANLVHHTCPYPGIHELLAALVARALPLAVLSNKPHEPTLTIVKQLFPQVPFVVVSGLRDPYPKKPDPTSALAIAGELAVRPSRIAFVGDTAVDIQTASRAGMLPVGAVWGFRDAAELEEAGAAILLAEPGELLSHLV